jgi:hypothetical protein
VFVWGRQAVKDAGVGVCERLMRDPVGYSLG